MPVARHVPVCSAILLSLFALHASAAPDPSPPPSAVNATVIENSNSAAASHKALHALFAAYWEDYLASEPETASALGDKRLNDKLSDASAAAQEKQLQKSRALLEKLAAFDKKPLSAPDRLSLQLLQRQLQHELDGARFTPWQMPLSHISGPHLEYAQLPSRLDFSSAKDYRDYIARLKALPTVFQDNIQNMRLGMAKGLTPLRRHVEKAAKQCLDLADMPEEKSPYAAPLAKFPADISPSMQKELRKEVLQAIRQHVTPAYRQLAQFLQQDYLSKARKDEGIWSLPDGAARYAHRIKGVTAQYDAEQIHQIGLQEVARIEAEMLKIAKQMGHPDIAAFNRAIKNNPALFATSREDILQRYRDYTAQMYPKLDKLFGRLPKAPMVIEAIESFREHGAPGAQYQHGPEDGSKPGRVVVNTSEFAKRSLLQIESTALHEGVPGHHFQIALAQESTDLPTFRRHGHYGAFIEGWALYAESLGREVGAYQDPYSYYGHLQAEMMRAIRLVVDTGLHHKKWSSEQVKRYFRDHSAMDEVSIQSETERYIAWPGQALTYKLGQIQFSALRRQAEQALGKEFDLRGFHDMLLASGGLPLDVMQEQVKSWIAQQKVLAQVKTQNKS
ncbi:DUF885 family protein [Massilia sp. W12]|uniref:DUF885 domain-containing protein n=1 Tax=Massilia sp. W12 TaxID=3126507 RepID=UPI0030CDDC20